MDSDQMLSSILVKPPLWSPDSSSVSINPHWSPRDSAEPWYASSPDWISNRIFDFQVVAEKRWNVKRFMHMFDHPQKYGRYTMIGCVHDSEFLPGALKAGIINSKFFRSQERLNICLFVSLYLTAHQCHWQSKLGSMQNVPSVNNDWAREMAG